MPDKNVINRAHRARYDLEGLSVLVVDDAPFMRAIVETILHALRVKNIVAVADAANALGVLKSSSVDIAIVDWHMPPPDGLDLLRRLRTAPDSPNPTIPVVMLTGFTEGWRVREARDAGVSAYLAKPISVHSVYSKIVSIIDKPRQFLKSDTYFGPDRRFKNAGPPTGMAERRRYQPRSDAQERLNFRPRGAER